MTLHLNLIIQNNQFHFIPKIHLHTPSNEDDFTVFSTSWLCFNFVLTTREILSAATYWRDIVNELVDNDRETMVKLDALVGNYMEYDDEQFARKARWIAKGCI